MSDTSFLIIIGLLLVSSSGFFLKYVLKFDNTLDSCLIPFILMLTGIIVATQLRNFDEAMMFFGAAVVQFVGFIFISRFRQRSSFAWHANSASVSNGAWYLTMSILKLAEAYWLFLVPYMIGIISGRTSGMAWAQYIEKKFHLKADAAMDDRLAPGQRLTYILKEPMFWILCSSLAVNIFYSCFYLGFTQLQQVLVVIGLGLLQNFVGTINTRAQARGSNWYITTTGLCSGLAFSLSAVYLFSRGMPMFLFIPYTTSTALGSSMGAFCSMIIEWSSTRIKESKWSNWFGDLRPDQHLKENKKEKTKEEIELERLPYKIIFALGLYWIVFQEPLFRLLGWSVTPLKFPFSGFILEWPRTALMTLASAIFFFDNAFHSINSRAGNRNHSGYHAITCIPKGLADFSKNSYIARNSGIVDIVPVSILAGCLGSLYGKDLSQKVEKYLQARMDVEQTPVKKPALSS